MKVWTIHFLGVPCAYRGEQQAHLRSRETWAVLASLILPSLLRGNSLDAVPRETLANRFWSDSEATDPRTHLRQCLASIRDAWGEACLITDRQNVQVAPGWFCTDMEIALTAYRKAQETTNKQERLYRLTEAEAMIRGEFFEGWTPDSEEAQIWLIHLRADIRCQLVAILLLLAQTLEEVGNLNGAFDIARRILRFQPGHRQARQIAWKLALATGQQDVMEALHQTQSFREAVSRFSGTGLNAVTLKEGRLFQALFEAELNTLAPGLRNVLLRLSVLPAPFPVEIAEAVCHTSLPNLQALARTPFVQEEAGCFLLPRLIRDSAWKQLPTATKRLLRKRLALFSIESWTPRVAPPPERLPGPFRSIEQAKPFLLQALEWMLEQPPTYRFLDFINRLRYHGFPDLAERGIPYLRKVVYDSAVSIEMRLDAAEWIAYIRMARDQHSLAVSELEAALQLFASDSKSASHRPVSGTLMMACHYAGDSERAILYGSRSLRECRSCGNAIEEAHILRFLGEIHTHLGDFARALAYCEEALVLRQGKEDLIAPVADALYWMAKCLFRLERLQEAQEAGTQALANWQQEGDLTGIGFCMRLLGQIRGAEGRYAEARAHLEYAILLHERTEIEVNRIAAVEVLGDILLADRQIEEAQSRYHECLNFYAARELESGKARLQDKMVPRPS